MGITDKGGGTEIEFCMRKSFRKSNVALGVNSSGRLNRNEKRCGSETRLSKRADNSLITRAEHEVCVGHIGYLYQS